MRAQQLLPRRARWRYLFLQLLLAAFADRREVQSGLDVLFERGDLFAADDDAGDGSADVREKFAPPLFYSQLKHSRLITSEK
jgi:hypothetical protein